MEAIRKVLAAEGVKEAHFLIDAPISNSGRLSSKIEDMFIGSNVNAICEVINDVDKNLYDKENVITSDAIILDNCVSWFNLTGKAIEAEIGDYPFVIIMKQRGNKNEKAISYDSDHACGLHHICRLWFNCGRKAGARDRGSTYG